MRLILCSLPALAGAISEHDPDTVVSVVGRGEAQSLPIIGRNHLHLAFNDVQQDRGSWRAPTARHVERLLAAVDAWSDHTVLVHCHEARSRSPAVVLTIMGRLGMSGDDAVRTLRAVAPWVEPHAGFLRLADAALGHEGGLTKAMLSTHVEMHSSSDEPVERRSRLLPLAAH